MEAETVPTRSIAASLRAAWMAGRYVLGRAARLALDIALPRDTVANRGGVKFYN